MALTSISTSAITVYNWREEMLKGLGTEVIPKLNKISGIECSLAFNHRSHRGYVDDSVFAIEKENAETDTEKRLGHHRKVG